MMWALKRVCCFQDYHCCAVSSANLLARKGAMNAGNSRGQYQHEWGTLSGSFSMSTWKKHTL